MYSTGLQEDWDPTHPKFNVDALFDPEAFQEEGKVSLSYIVRFVSSKVYREAYETERNIL